MPSVERAKVGHARPSQTFSRVDPGSVPSFRGALPWGAVGALVLIVVVEFALARHPLHLADPVSLSWRHAAALAGSKAREAEILLAGDSLIMHGVAPSLVRGQTGLEAINLGAARAPALYTYFLVRRVLNSGARPRAIVFCAKPAVLMGGPDYDARYWQEVLSAREFLELAAMTRRGGLALELAAGRLLPSLRSRLEIRSWITAALGGRTDPVAAVNRVLWRNWTVNHGANMASARFPFNGRLESDDALRLRADRFHVDRTNALGIDRLLALASREHVPIYWLLPPLSVALQARRDSSGAEAAYEAFVRENVERHPGVVVLDARRSGFSDALFCDATHLNARGATVLTRLVAQAATTASALNWITLDRLADPLPPEPLDLEDVEESKAIVEQ